MAWTYADLVPGMVLIGIGAALVMPTVSGSVMGSVPQGDTGVGSATNGTFIQIGGALGVAVIGSLLSSRYQASMTAALAPHHVAHGLEQTILGSIGAALGVAAQAGGAIGAFLVHAARVAFVSGADLGLKVAAVVALGGCALALAALPSRLPTDERRERGPEGRPEGERRR